MRLFLTAFIILHAFLSYAQRTCGTDDRHQHRMSNDANARQLAKEIEDYASQFLQNRQMMKAGEQAEIIIPVVFHIVHYNTTQNISDQRIHEQIDILNKDFNALNTDIRNVPVPFQSVIGKLNIKFVLANRDPQGKITTGINRIRTSKSSNFSDNDDVKSKSTGGTSAWDTKSYLNIWVCNLGNRLLGYASFPYDAGRLDDGVVLNYRYVGITGAFRPFHYGRTATHEIGHYFNLNHIWGDANNCTKDDNILDTPLQYGSSSGVPVFPDLTDICANTYPGKMFMNFMDYSDDTTLLMFTKLQSVRMLATLNGPRSSLLSSKGYIPVKNMDLSTYGINSPMKVMCDNEIIPSLNVVSVGNEVITGFDVSMQVDGGEIITKRWTGSLSLYDTAQINFEPVLLENGTYRIKYRVYNTNDMAKDDEPANDTSSIIFTVGVQSKLLPLTEDFESINISTNGFSIVNPDKALTWTRASVNISKKGSYSYFMNNYEYNPDTYGVDYGEKDDIELPFLNFTDVEEIAMTFELSAAQHTPVTQAANNWDTLQVLVSVDCGLTYDVVYNKYAGSLITVPSAQTNAFIPSTSQWRKEEVDLTKYAGYNNVKVIIRNISHFENNIYIDDLNLYKGRVVSAREYIVNNRDIELYPNPSNGIVTLKVNDPSSRLKQVTWVNALGQIVSESSANSYSNTLQFSLSQKPKGIYIAKLLFEDGSVTTKKLLLD